MTTKKITKNWQILCATVVLAISCLIPYQSYAKTHDNSNSKKVDKALIIAAGVSKTIIDAIDVLEEYESSSTNEDVTVKKLLTLVEKARKEVAKAKEIEKKDLSKRLLGDTDVRLEWAQHNLNHNGLKRRAHLMGYFYQAQIKLLFAYYPATPKSK